jgi:hypothetical protein
VPRYFFDTIDNDQRTTDEAGLDLTDREAMRRVAVETLPHMALDALPDGAVHEFAVEVRDEAGRPVFRAALSFRSEWLDEGQGERS